MATDTEYKRKAEHVRIIRTEEPKNDDGPWKVEADIRLGNHLWGKRTETFWVLKSKAPALYARMNELPIRSEFSFLFEMVPREEGGNFKHILSLSRPGNELRPEEVPEPYDEPPPEDENVYERKARELDTKSNPFVESPAPQETRSAPRDNSQDGMAFGAAQNAVSRVLAAFIAREGRPPDDAEVDWMLTFLKDMTDRAFRNRLPL